MRILVFQHHSTEHPGVFRDFWANAGHELTTVELDAGEPIPDFDGFDLLAVMGGPMNVWQEDEYPWLRTEKQAIRRRVKHLGKPYFGICLGHQLLADALGGEVQRMARSEVGLAEVELTPAGQLDSLFRGLPVALRAFQWHGCEVSALPDGAEVLASNPHCPVQAMRWGRHAYGVQFHPEISQSTITDWKNIPEYWEDLVNALGHDEAAALAAKIQPRLGDFRNTARSINERLMALTASHHSASLRTGGAAG